MDVKVNVDPETLYCLKHDTIGCSLCMISDFRAWLRARIAARKRAEAPAPALPVHERFDLGGES